MLILCLVFGVVATDRIEAATAKILKVLPHFLDREGRIALAPSLFERDAYQAILRSDRSLCSGLRFDVQWKAKTTRATDLRLRLELVTTTAPRDRPIVLEQPIKGGRWGSHWARLKLEQTAFRQAGEMIAWRASVWDGAQLVAEQKSFLW